MKKYLIILLILLAIAFQGRYVKAATGYDDPAKPKYDKKWNLTWTTLDDKRSGYPYWETVGFTVRADRCLESGYPDYGNPRLKPYGQIDKKEIKKSSDPVPGTGDVNTTFLVDHDVVERAVKKAKVTPVTLKANAYNYYLDGIFQIHYSSKKTGNKIYTLKGIMYPSKISWATPGDFKDRFDVPVPFDSQPQPVKITYMETNNDFKTTYKTISNEDPGWTANYQVDPTYTFENGCGLQFSTTTYKTLSVIPITNNPGRIPLKKSKVVNGVKEEYYLYRVHWANLKDPLKDTKHGMLRQEHEKMAVVSNPYVDWDSYRTEAEVIRSRDFTVQNGGTEIVAIYKKFKKYKDINNETTISKDFTDPSVHGTIEADTYGNSRFSVKDGIPTTETVYATAGTSQQTLIRYTFTKHFGTKYYQKKVIDSEATEEEPEVSHMEMVSRSYSYYTIDQLDIYTLDRADISNYCLPGGSVSISAAGNIKITSFIYGQYGGEGGHLIEPAQGREEVGQIRARNDALSINGKVILNDGWQTSSTSAPNISVYDVFNKTAEEGPAGCFFKSDLLIEGAKSNGEFESSGYLFYKNAAHIGDSSEETLDYDFDVNEVIIHTPVVCDTQISDRRQYNQMLQPDKSCAALVLDRTFLVKFPTTGSHLDIKGYGTRDYAKYTQARQVQFPFDVYIGNTYIPKDNWYTVTNDETKFYLPIWVEEGGYTINCRSVSINTVPNLGLDKTEELANTDYENYVATDTMDVEISGRLYGLKLYDISDYPVWQKTFRMPNSLEPSGFNYSVGTKNQNGEGTGRNPKYTLTLVNGSHPFYKNIGVIKTGYVTRFYFTTVGNMYSDKDYIWIKPRFYYMDTQGKNRQEVDLYYSETFQGKKQNLVKMGSNLDQMNKKAYRLGDSYFGVPQTEWITKSVVTGKPIKKILGEKKNLFSFTNILIPENLRTYIGANYTPTGVIPEGVNPNKVTVSMQKWYGEYYLPSEVHVAPKDFEVYEYARNHYGIDYKESFWLKNGYIIVNFDIETIQNGERHLSYQNLFNAEEGYCNMWKMEGYQYQKKDYKGTSFSFQDGDYILYYTDQSAAKDYISAGTH